MAKDERLYARFDIAMDEHPKIALLSDAAFRALFEATLYSRRQLTDGFLPGRIAERRWGQTAIDELCANDPERPSLFSTVKGGVDGYQIHDYAKHQTTTADIEAKREAGRKGGLAKASKGVAPATDQLEQTASTSLAKTETETETETPSSTKKGERATRGSRLDPEWLPTSVDVAKVRAECPDVDPKAEHAAFVDYWVAVPGAKGLKLDWSATWRNWMRRKQGDVAKGTKQTPTQKAQRTVMLATELLEIDQ